MTKRGGAFIAVALLVFALGLACSDDDEPKEPLRLEELSQRITDSSMVRWHRERYRRLTYNCSEEIWGKRVTRVQ